MNIVDILSILPFFIELFMHEEGLDEEENLVTPDGVTTTEGLTPWLTNSTSIAVEEEEDDDGSFKGLVQVFRVFKLARVFKMAR